jgi:PEGA domain
MRLPVALFVFLLSVGTVLGQSPSKDGIPVTVVATATEYVPRSTTISHPGHAYTDCSGTADYLGRFDSSSGSISISGDTRSSCSTTFTPPREDTFTSYKRVNYTVVEGGNVLYLVACTQTWKIKTSSRVLLGVMGAAAGGTGADTGPTDRAAANARGKWTDCPAFPIGSQYSLRVQNTSDARLVNGYESKPMKLDYLTSASLPAQTSRPAQPTRIQEATSPTTTKVHVTSSPDGGEIYVDGKFYGNTPSDISLQLGEHTFRIIMPGKEWNRSVQVTGGEITVHAN